MFLRRQGPADSAQLRTDLHLPQRLDTVPVNSLEVLTVRRQHGRKEEALVAQVLHDRVGDRNSVSTRVDATRETIAMEFGQYHGGLVRRRSSAGFRLWLGCVAGDRRDSSARGQRLDGNPNNLIMPNIPELVETSLPVSRILKMRIIL